MQLRNTESSFGWITIILHWLMAILVIGLFASGIWMVDLDYYSSWYQRAPQWHIAIGIAVGGLIILRLIWHRISRKPEPDAEGWQKPAARAAHASLYLLMILMVCSGYLIPAADGKVMIFDWFALPGGETLNPDTLGTIHEFGGWGLILLSAMHGLGALSHHLFQRDNTLRRMLRPGR